MRRALIATISIVSIALLGLGIGIWAQAAPTNAAAAATALTARTVEADGQGQPTNRPVQAEVTIWRLGADGSRSLRTVRSSGGSAAIGNLPAGVYFAGAVPTSGYEPFNDDDGPLGYAGLVPPCEDLRACVMFTVDAQGGMKVFYPHGVRPTDGALDFLFRRPMTTPPASDSSTSPQQSASSTGSATPATPAPPAATKRILVSVFDTTPGSTNRYVKGADVLVSDPSANRVPRAGSNLFYSPTNDRGLAMFSVRPNSWTVYVTLPAGYVFDNDQATKVVQVPADGGPVFGVGFKARRVSETTTTSTPQTETPRTQTPVTVRPEDGTPAPSTTTPTESVPGVEQSDGTLRYPYPDGVNPYPTPRGPIPLRPGG